ncbi:baseplate protein [Campylobacter sp. faydin G-24]|uniref:Baseplate protein n=1 Tax=Campylobacter anatolicus TaxID=2829105 RepID=A0ABS5HJ29_9BACT|nr:Gp138 family membrane-puncturing spike protein [Campylobacter anatolicus]MBR8461469.1 baseplate protein [Campylobacter anatolicus]MBR8464273.1 baseplate protein [Campylobacter anatolicus]
MTEANLTQVLNATQYELQRQIHTALPARVIKFNSADNTVGVELMVNEITRDGKSIVLPPIYDIPVQFFRGGEFVITTPINAGDFGLCVFAERCIDSWFLNAKKSTPLDFRLHDYSDGFFITGFSPKSVAVSSVDSDGVCMRTLDKSTYIKLTKGTIFIKGNVIQEGDYTQSGDLNLKGALAQTGGNAKTSGIITAEDVIGGGISLKAHTHGGDSGGSTTQPR